MHGTVACYMIAAELTTIRSVYFLADTALANIVANDFEITSSFTTIDCMYISNSCITLDGLCTLAAKHPVGCCWRAVCAINCTLANCYIQAMATPVPEERESRRRWLGSYRTKFVWPAVRTAEAEEWWRPTTEAWRRRRRRSGGGVASSGPGGD